MRSRWLRWLLATFALALTLATACKPKTDTAAPAADTSSGPTISFPSVGVSECDDYLNKVTSCLNSKVPGASRQEIADGIEQNAATWRQLAASPDTSATLPELCAQAVGSARSSFGSTYGCSF